MKTLFLFLALYAYTQDTTRTVVPKAKEVYVYICDSKSAKAYHKDEECSGLNRCTHPIKKVTKNNAVDIGRAACKLCY